MNINDKFPENALFTQLMEICKPTVDKIKARTTQSRTPSLFPRYSQAAACNQQDEIYFDQLETINHYVGTWARKAVKSIKTEKDVKLSEFLGDYLEISEQAPINSREMLAMRIALLETLQLYNAKALTFPIACKILIAGLHGIKNLLDDEWEEPFDCLTSLIMFVGGFTSHPYTQTLINFIE